MEKLRNVVHKRGNLLLWVALPLLSLLMHLPVMHLPLQGIHAWRQCETASNIEHFASQGGSIMDPHVYSLEWEGGLKRMEFPLMQWLVAQPYGALGGQVWVMRLCMWLIGIVTMLGIHRLLRSLFRDGALALAGAWCWTFSPVLFYYTVNPLPDNFSLMAAAWGMALGMEWWREGKAWKLLLAFACFSLATATKLPFVLFFSFPAGLMLARLVAERGRNWLGIAALGIAGLALLAPSVQWYLWVIPQWTGNGVVEGILDTQAEDIPVLVKILGKNIVVILPELLLNYGAVLFFVWGMWRIWRERLFRHALALPFGLFALAAGAYFIFEINMITTVHDYYLFPFMPGLFVLVTMGLARLLSAERAWLRRLSWALLLVLPVTCGLRAYTRWAPKNMPAGVLAHVEELRAATPADARIVFANDLSPHISLYHLRHHGWTFDLDEFNADKYRDWLKNKGASHLYSNSRAVEAHPVVSATLGELVGKYGEVWVWKLSPTP